MGIPGFYRWFAERFPLSVVDAAEANGIEFDNLYLDMNGIIHPCFHPEDKEAPSDYGEVFEAMFAYIDTLFHVVRPRKLLYLAIDGVAPRAKMNQQRSRRFKAAKDSEEGVPSEGGRRGAKKATSLDDESSQLDSNVITPGTEFMALLSSALNYYIHLRMNNDPGWQGIKVILSDSSVPGEGEHKIMSYIRLQRNLPAYDPNTRHCLYGLDADLIMLALATHEIHFSILRENVQKHAAAPKWLKQKRSSEPSNQIEAYSKMRFQFIHAWIFREYLAYAIKIPDRTVSGDFERLIDDFIFMCFFIGNDFLPQLPTLKIYEGAIDFLIAIYKKEFVRMGGYLTNSCEVNLPRVKHFLQALAGHEADILRRRDQMETKRSKENQRSSWKGNVARTPAGKGSVKVQAPDSSACSTTTTKVDKIKYRASDWKERYYADKFDVVTEEDRERIRNDLVLKYIEGVCWVMHYYYGGVCSWQWFYPYHYAPFASDFHDIEKLEIQFTVGEPFKPFDQLMAVLPAASGHALPLSYRKLMTDPLSPLVPFYPADFELDMDGKRFSWQAICKLPFIEEFLLLSEIAKIEHTLTDEERQRNTCGLDLLFVHICHPLVSEIVSFYKKNIGDPGLATSRIEQIINPELSGGMNGYMVISDKDVHPMVIDSPINGMEKISNNQTLSVLYRFPPFHPHIPIPPEGVEFPHKSIRKKHIQPAPHLWHEWSTVVGWLHINRPIRGSIYGRRLGKSARQLVLTWYLKKQEESKKSLGHSEGGKTRYFKSQPECKKSLGPGEGASTDLNQCHENLKTVCPAHTVSDGNSNSASKKQNKKSKKKQNTDGEPPITQVVITGQTSTLLPSGNSTSKNRKRKRDSGSKHLNAHVVANRPASISSTEKRVSTAAKSGNDRVKDSTTAFRGMGDNRTEGQSDGGKLSKTQIAVSGPKSTSVPSGNSTSKKQKRKGNSGSERLDARTVANGPVSISSTGRTVPKGNAGVGDPASISNSGIISTAVSSVDDRNRGNDGAIANGPHKPPFSLKLRDPSLTYRVLDADQADGDNKGQKRKKLKKKVVIIMEPNVEKSSVVGESESKTRVEGKDEGGVTITPNEPTKEKNIVGETKSETRVEGKDEGGIKKTPIFLHQEKQNSGGEFRDTPMVLNSGNDRVGDPATAYDGMGGIRTEKQNNGGKFSETQIASSRPESTLLPSGNRTSKKRKRKWDSGSEHLDAQIVTNGRASNSITGQTFPKGKTDVGDRASILKLGIMSTDVSSGDDRNFGSDGTTANGPNGPPFLLKLRDPSLTYRVLDDADQPDGDNKGRKGKRLKKKVVIIIEPNVEKSSVVGESELKTRVEGKSLSAGL